MAVFFKSILFLLWKSRQTEFAVYMQYCRILGKQSNELGRAKMISIFSHMENQVAAERNYLMEAHCLNTTCSSVTHSSYSSQTVEKVT